MRENEYEDEIERMRARQKRKKETIKPVADPKEFWLDGTDPEEDTDLEEFWLDDEDPEIFGPEAEEYDWIEEDEPVQQNNKKNNKNRKQQTEEWDEDLEEISLNTEFYHKPEIQVVSFRESQAARNTKPPRKSAALQDKRQLKHGTAKKKRRSHKLRNFLILLFLFCGIFFFFQKKEEGFWTVAVFGVDSRDGKLEKGAHSDVIMLCSLNRPTGEIKLVSVYRDTYLKTDDGEYGKINSAYFNGGHEQAIAALEENLDLKIDDYATFSWAAVADAISTLGGVDVEITDSEFEYINAFITETVESTGLGSVQLEHPGLNHLDGVQAVAYARLRLMDTDYQRTARQRLILSLTVDKAKQANFSTLSDLVMSVLPKTATSIGVSDILSLAKHIDRYYLGENAGFPFSRGDARIAKQLCVVPLTLESNVAQLHQFLYGTENYTPSAAVQKISNQIASDSGLGEVAENAPEASVGGSGGESHTSVQDSESQSEVPSTASDESTEVNEETATEAESESVAEESETETETAESPEDASTEEVLGETLETAETAEETNPMGPDQKPDYGPGQESSSPLEGPSVLPEPVPDGPSSPADNQMSPADFSDPESPGGNSDNPVNGPSFLE